MISRWKYKSTNTAKTKAIKIYHARKRPTKLAALLCEALQSRGLLAKTEYHDGHKTIDIVIPKSKIDIEVDGIQHLTSPRQILADLNRSYYSNKQGYKTIHIPNELLKTNLDKIANAICAAAVACELKIYFHYKSRVSIHRK